MLVDEIVDLFEYDRWANNRIFGALESVGTAEVVRDRGGAHGSLHATAVHLVWGEWLWLQRFRGESPDTVFQPSSFPDLASIVASLRAVDRDMKAFLDSVTDDALRSKVAYRGLQGRRWEYRLDRMMMHLVNHSTYHRGQLAFLLRKSGVQPPPTDFLVFIDECPELC